MKFSLKSNSSKKTSLYLAVGKCSIHTGDIPVFKDEIMNIYIGSTYFKNSDVKSCYGKITG